MKRRAKPSLVEFLVLAVMDRTRCGSEIFQQVDRITGSTRRLSLESLYQLLKRLVAKGLISENSSHSPEKHGRGRTKTYYDITSDGVETFEATVLLLQRVLAEAPMRTAPRRSAKQLRQSREQVRPVTKFRVTGSGS
jgi:DNA-binding PadR family transcriptional regulator